MFAGQPLRTCELPVQRCDANADGNQHIHADRNNHSNRNTNTHTHGHSHCYTNRDLHRHTNQYSDTDAAPIGYSDGHSNAAGWGDPGCGNTDCNEAQFAFANPDAGNSATSAGQRTPARPRMRPGAVNARCPGEEAY